MHCTICNAPDTKVIDSRLLQEGDAVRRRRKCDSCLKRFTTYERLEIQMPVVIKHDGRIENFNNEKVSISIKKACHKRAISMIQIDSITESLEKYIVENFEKEVTTDKVGEFIMERLLLLDPVSYVRFASFYWDFENIDEFISALQEKLKLLKLDGKQ